MGHSPYAKQRLVINLPVQSVPLKSSSLNPLFGYVHLNPLIPLFYPMPFISINTFCFHYFKQTICFMNIFVNNFSHICTLLPYIII